MTESPALPATRVQIATAPWTHNVVKPDECHLCATASWDAAFDADTVEGEGSGSALGAPSHNRNQTLTLTPGKAVAASDVATPGAHGAEAKTPLAPTANGSHAPAAVPASQSTNKLAPPSGTVSKSARAEDFNPFETDSAAGDGPFDTPRAPSNGAGNLSVAVAADPFASNTPQASPQAKVEAGAKPVPAPASGGKSAAAPSRTDDDEFPMFEAEGGDDNWAAFD